jgi:hypothetical protein
VEDFMTDLALTARTIALSGKVEPADILSLRRAIFADGVVSRDEAEALFDIERTRTAHNPEWSQLFVEALTDYTLNQEPPVGYLTDSTAEWVTGQLKRRKTPSTDADLELVTNIIEQAREVPASFSAFALGLAKQEVVYGDGPDARGRMHVSGRVTQADVITLQRILWGAGSEGLLAVSRDEAEALFSIADATTGADNAPEFDDLFAKAIGNYLLGATGHAVPSRDVSLRWETEPAHKTDILSILGHVFGPNGVSKELWPDEPMDFRTLKQDIELEHKTLNDARDADRALAEIMTPEKAGWLRDHVGKNGVMTGPEKALVRFIARESSALDASLKDVLSKVA